MKDFKIIHISPSDIVYDPAQAGRMLENACLRQNGGWRVTGGIQLDRDFAVTLERSPEDVPETGYYFSRIPDRTPEGCSADLTSRYMSGMSLLSYFCSGDDLWGFFSKII